jgi:hypothetical protein
MKTQTQIKWNATEQNDWTGIELIDTETGETHATIDGCTPEALALIANAPDLLEALRVAGNALDAYSGGESADLETIRQAIARAEGGAK